MYKPISESYHSDLGVVALEVALVKYREDYGINPVTLCVPIEELRIAYEIVQEPFFRSLVVVPIPGLPLDSWFVCGSHGVAYSEGA